MIRFRKVGRGHMPKREKISNDDYYWNGERDRTEHFAQGDIFSMIPFPMAMEEPPPPDEDTGEGTRRVLETPLQPETWGMLLSHTSGFVAQPEGTRGYAHPFRVMAPIVPMTSLVERGLVPADAVHLLRKEDKMLHYMYLPPCPGGWDGEGAVQLYRPALVHRGLLEGRRIAQLEEPAVRQLMAKVTEAFSGRWFGPENFPANVSDHWNPPDPPV
jgi:hypothetical protein